MKQPQLPNALRLMCVIFLASPWDAVAGISVARYARESDAVAKIRGSHKAAKNVDRDWLVWNQAHHLIIICETFVTMISGLPLGKMIFPETATVRPSYCCGLGNCAAMPERLKAVTASFGSLLPKVRENCPLAR